MRVAAALPASRSSPAKFSFSANSSVSKVCNRKELGYDGPLTIEREISGPQQIEDIRKEKQYLEKLIA
jgi:hypothetical protein